MKSSLPRLAILVFSLASGLAAAQYDGGVNDPRTVECRKKTEPVLLQIVATYERAAPDAGNTSTFASEHRALEDTISRLRRTLRSDGLTADACQKVMLELPALRAKVERLASALPKKAPGK